MSSKQQEAKIPLYPMVEAHAAPPSYHVASLESGSTTYTYQATTAAAPGVSSSHYQASAYISSPSAPAYSAPKPQLQIQDDKSALLGGEYPNPQRRRCCESRGERRRGCCCRCLCCTCKCICITSCVIFAFLVVLGSIAGAIFGVQNSRCANPQFKTTDTYTFSLEELSTITVNVGANLAFLQGGQLRFQTGGVTTTNVTISTTLSSANQNLLNGMTLSRGVADGTMTFSAQASSTAKPVWWTTFWDCPSVSSTWTFPPINAPVWASSNLAVGVTSQNLPVYADFGGATLASLSLATTNGDVSASNTIVSGVLSLSSTNSDLTVSNVRALSQPMTLSTTNADVSLSSVVAPTLGVTSTNGRILIQSTTTGLATMSTTNGNVQISTGINGVGLLLNKTMASSCGLSIQSTNSDIQTYNLAFGAGSQACNADFQTTNGKINTYLYQGGPTFNCAYDGTYTMTATNGYSQVDCTNAGRACQSASQYDGNTASGTIGSSTGSDSYTAYTTNGQTTLSVMRGCPIGV